jgi:hypothetical protein
MELKMFVEKLQEWEELLETHRQQLEQDEWNSLQQVPEAKEMWLDPEELEEAARTLRRERTKVLPKVQGAYQRALQRVEGQLGVLYAGFLQDFQAELEKLPRSELRKNVCEELRRDSIQ